MPRRILLSATVALTMSACHVLQPDLDLDKRFIGTWLVHETEPHALYSASMFRFEADGELRQVWDAGFYEGTHGYVQSPDASVICAFGSKWRSRDAQVLTIDGVCDDGMSREIKLGFPPNTSQNSAAVSIVIMSVAGEAQWLPPRWGWAFKKCESRESSPEECGAVVFDHQ